MLKRLVPIPFIRNYSGLQHGNQIVLLSCTFSLLLLFFRVFYTGHILFIFLIWNLVLALIPYGISGWLSRRKTVYRPALLLCTAVWLLFIPNAFYILTDLFHLDMDTGVPLWYDLALLLSFAWSGLTAGVYSVRQMEKLFINSYGNGCRLLFVYAVLFLNALGIYIGRYLRFNSWDVISNPFQLTANIFHLLYHPLRARHEWGMIVCYTVLLAVIYKTIGRSFGDEQ